MANALSISRPTLTGYENGKTEPSASLLKDIAAYFNVSLDELLLKDLGAPLFSRQTKSYLENKDIRVLPITVGTDKKENIEFIPISATAGYAIDFLNTDFIGSLTRFRLPKHPEGAYRAFEIKGDSMLPIQSGSIIIGRYVEHWKDFKNGQRYILVLKNEGAVFKRVVNEVEKNRRLILLSDNPEFLPFTTKIDDLLEAWEMFSFIGFNNKMPNYHP